MSERVDPASAVAAVRAVCAARGGTSAFVAVDGCGASGKTSFAAECAAAVPELVVVHVDDFAGPTIPEWDWGRMQTQLVDPLLAHRPARYQRWGWDADRGGEWCEVPPGLPVLIEGVSSRRRELRVPWALTIWIDVPRSVRLDRAVARDGPELLERWLTDWMPSEDAYVAREDPAAHVDLVVNGISPAITVDARRREHDVLLVAHVGERVVGTARSDGHRIVDVAVPREFLGYGIAERLAGHLPRSRP